MRSTVASLTWISTVRRAVPGHGAGSRRGVTEVADLSGANWRTSSWSGAIGGNCIQVADLPGTIAVRDSKDPDGPALLFTPAEWAAFTARVKAS
jgi:hypothetical protein